MSEIEARGSNSEDSSDWNHAWSTVSRLAAARGTTWRERGADDRCVSIASTIALKLSDPRFGSDFAGIERAAAALLRAEPALEPRAPDPQADREPRTARSTWPMGCVICPTAAAVV